MLCKLLQNTLAIVVGKWLWHNSRAVTSENRSAVQILSWHHSFNIFKPVFIANYLWCCDKNSTIYFGQNGPQVLHDGDVLVWCARRGIDYQNVAVRPSNICKKLKILSLKSWSTKKQDIYLHRLAFSYTIKYDISFLVWFTMLQYVMPISHEFTQWAI